MRNFSAVLKTLPQSPGVYLYHGPNDVVIYVGKAVNLRSRVMSYFRKSAGLTPAKIIMLEEIHRVEHIIVRTETEALLLESTLIKKYRPKYNIILKDDKYFQYIKITLPDPFPQVMTVRRITLDSSRYFGPYTSGAAVRQTFRILKRIFPYKSCNNPINVPCFDYQLGRCLGHDVEPGAKERYQEVIHKLIGFLEGKTGSVLKDMKQEMKQASKDQNFELAARWRDRIEALEHILEQQTVITSARANFDVLSLARLEDIAAVNLFQVRKGKLVQRDQFMLQHTQQQSDQDIFCAFIEQYYSQSTNHPAEIFVGVPMPKEYGTSLQLQVKQASRGLKKKLVSMGEENAQDYLKREKDRWLSEEAKARLGLQELAAALELPTPPHRIEMYDMSNFQGAFAVGSLVVFENGLPKKSDYRKFRIKTVEGPDDVHSMVEVLRRRFQRKNDGSWPLPDLLMLDGGKPQLNTVLDQVGEIPRDMPVAALAKQEEELFMPERKSSIRLKEGSAGLHLIQRIRDEAHRFAIGYYRKRHRAETTRSILDEIPGLGPSAKKQLIQKFGTIQGIRDAADDEITDVVGEQKAELIKKHL